MSMETGKKMKTNAKCFCTLNVDNTVSYVKGIAKERLDYILSDLGSLGSNDSTESYTKAKISLSAPYFF